MLWPHASYIPVKLRLNNNLPYRTSEGRIDNDLAESQSKLAQFLPPNDAVTLVYAICQRHTGDFLGMGGLVALEANFGWPAISYIFDKATWGQGYATEFLRAFLDMYRGLPRSKIELRVDPRTVVDPHKMEECIVANTVGTNDKSQKVLEKCGFKRVLDWQGRRCTMSTFQYFTSQTIITEG